ncbi:hypothetical protein ACJX0J_019077 [Zea mays]
MYHFDWEVPGSAAGVSMDDIIGDISIIYEAFFPQLAIYRSTGMTTKKNVALCQSIILSLAKSLQMILRAKFEHVKGYSFLDHHIIDNIVFRAFFVEIIIFSLAMYFKKNLEEIL